MTIWEEYGISIDDYARAFNKALTEAYQAHLENKVYFLQIDKDRNIRRVALLKNIGEASDE